MGGCVFQLKKKKKSFKSQADFEVVSAFLGVFDDVFLFYFLGAETFAKEIVLS